MHFISPERVSFFFLVFCLISCKHSSTDKQIETPQRPNIVIIFTDDQGYNDLGVFGSTIKTPHLDKMASQGVKLTNFYVAQAVCSASRAALLTGCYPNRIGIHNALMPNAKIGLNPKETTIAEMLKNEGYKTAIFGKWHLGDASQFLPTQHGFDEWFGIPYSNDMWPKHPQQGPIFNFPDLPLYENETITTILEDQSQLTTLITEKSVDFINRNKGNHFFLYVPHPQPHVPLYVSDKFKGKSDNGLYGDVIMEIDWSVGQINQALKDNGLEENTIVIFTSDNGPWLSYGNHAGSAYPLREGKGTAWEGGQREPFIIKYPKRSVIETPVMAIDLLPTIAELTDARLPKEVIDGKSIWKLLVGDTKESPQDAYFFYYRTNELFGVRYKKWKLYFPHHYRTMLGQEPGKDGIPGEYQMRAIEEIELYDLENDIGETNNVADSNTEVVEEIKLLANKMRYRLGDSLLELEGSETREPGRLE
ncbi:sulfatase family protein [Croceitalea rosinachiae]|uniref:Sulfatase n=1 Tax=Croceitalea rosinachiae TaxID=3075596 RepID=A0ABU3A6P5_9FLAO|nr:sulfatase [Croceitalea sp. F388]MDT0605841.1 sulfatase [Croceitalea sp. F388]